MMVKQLCGYEEAAFRLLKGTLNLWVVYLFPPKFVLQRWDILLNFSLLPIVLVSLWKKKISKLLLVLLS